MALGPQPPYSPPLPTTPNWPSVSYTLTRSWICLTPDIWWPVCWGGTEGSEQAGLRTSFFFFFFKHCILVEILKLTKKVPFNKKGLLFQGDCLLKPMWEHSNFSVVGGTQSPLPSNTATNFGIHSLHPCDRSVPIGWWMLCPLHMLVPCLEYPSCTLPDNVYSLLKAMLNVTTSGKLPECPQATSL